MPVIDDLELPIERLKIAGPAVRGLESRKEDNNNERVTVEKFWRTYEPVKQQVLGGLKALASRTFG